MALHGVQNPAATAVYVPHPVIVNRTVAGDSAIPQPPIAEKAQAKQNSYALSGDAGPNADNGSANHAVVASQGAAPGVVSHIAATLQTPPSTQQAPDAASIAGVSTYNYRGQLNTAPADAGRALHLTA